MATYAIGDIQGCFHTLEKLLEHMKFDPAQDILWFTGDLVNRGPRSLDTLRFIKQLGPQHISVLGNHDLHLLALSYNAHKGWHDDTLAAVLSAPDKNELLTWLKQLPLLHYDAKTNYCMVHAGVAPNWDLGMAMQLANEVSKILKSSKAADFFNHMYGNTPALWDNNLQGWDRLRCITNYLTRARYCHADGSLELDKENKNLLPWYQLPQRLTKDLNIIFGHWAALRGVTNTPHVFALDTGCVWGFHLTAMCLEDQTRFQVAYAD
jgi:bis(5'-nucleosyl)-tetraphosphatase (symmetrical)